jgi:hypothetical protein
MSYAFGQMAQPNSSTDPDDFFEHATETEVGKPPVSSEMPPEVAEVLKDILESPLGSKIRSSIHATGDKIKLALTVDPGHAFQVSHDGTIFYHPDIQAWRAWRTFAHPPPDATLGSLIAHEIGHTLTVRHGPVMGRMAEEIHVTRNFENVYRAHVGMRLRCTYATPGDVC